MDAWDGCNTRYETREGREIVQKKRRKDGRGGIFGHRNSLPTYVTDGPYGQRILSMISLTLAKAKHHLINSTLLYVAFLEGGSLELKLSLHYESEMQATI